MSTRKYYKPGKEGGKFVHRKYDGDRLVLDVEIGSEGFSTVDSTIQSELDRHPLKGHAAGFVEVDPPKRKKEQNTSSQSDNGDSDDGDEDPGDKDPKPEKTENTSSGDGPLIVGDYRIEEKGGGYKNLVHVETGKIPNEKGRPIEEAKELARELTLNDDETAEDPGGEDPDKQLDPEKVTNINQARDYLIDEGLDGRKLTSKKKIITAAKDLDPPVEFPNLD